jgi:cardiolipin synthase
VNIVNIPNLITFVRIVIVPLFITAMVYKRYDYALILFLIAALSDMLDGLFARLTKQKTKFGAFLDPLADKSLLITSFILFSIYDLIPLWLTITVISRDFIVVIGWVLLYLTSHTTKVEPSFIGKAAIASQLILIAYSLLSININIPSIGLWGYWVVAFLTIISGIQYIYNGLKTAG